MAISKILYIGDCGAGYSGKHLRQAIDYIMAREKTGGERWIGTLNCQQENIYEQMRSTKVQFGKTDQRQGYHLMISFVEGEVDAETAFDVIGRFTKEYLGKDFEAVYSVHDNTDHIHGHIVFNSVSFRTGIKYRYKKGDWAKYIQPITNRLCEEYGLSTIDISEDRVKTSENYHEWNDFRNGKFVWADMIKRDLDACIMQAPTYDSFLSLLSEMGYEIKQGKYLAIKPMGLTRYKRCKSLGANYTEERIRERILTENLSDILVTKQKDMPQIVRCRIKRYHRAKLSGLQKRYFSKLYRMGQLKKRPYSQAYKYRNEIRKMQQLQEEYLFLSRYEISNGTELAVLSENMTVKKKEVQKEKSKIYKERAGFKPLFDIMEEMIELKYCENCYQKGEALFAEEHERFLILSGKLLNEGYTIGQLQKLKEHYRNEVTIIYQKEKFVVREERTAKRLLMGFQTTETVQEKENQYSREEPNKSKNKKI
ncbi:relaxase/mobilization nuclease domain-containing protein [Anaerosporobacter sp.]|uniref:relaxase/mobilization nuclease domain-containing protein n=1 Tax=Anaerosporobacter sp. TaxID=1872529 RepID=UPI00286F109B|nr:relaxase/mobilization nuclease domain-containing protein [Anaerosporobacter sp.]